MAKEKPLSILRDIELLRAYMRAGIVFIFMTGLWYVMTNYISPSATQVMDMIKSTEFLSVDERAITFKLIEQAISSQIPSATVWSWFTGVVTGTLIIYYFGEKAMDKLEKTREA